MIRSLSIALTIFFFSPTVFSNSKSQDRPPRHIVFGLDGVSYEAFKKMHAAKYFQGFKRPAPMVATFPSISDPNWNRIMNTPVDESYTKIHFDTDAKTENGKGKAKGNLLTNLKSELSFYSAFDFHPESELETFSIVGWTETTGKYLLDSIEKNFFDSRKKTPYMAYVMNSDMLSHMGGEKQMLSFLKYVDKTIKKMRRTYLMRYGEPLHVTIISDHGNAYVTPKFIQFEEPLKKAGWKTTTTLSGEKDVAIVIPEILSFGAFYTKSGKEPSLAKSLSKIKGVDITSYSPSRETVILIGDKGRARFEFAIDEKNKSLKLVRSKGRDFLNQAKLFKKSRLSWDDYFYGSLSSEYPNAVVNLWEGFYRNSIQGASVLVSTERDHAFANDSLKLVAKLKGTLQSLHGSLHKEQSFGIFVSTKFEVDAIRPSDFLKVISQNQRQAAK